jgi:hypothetical protein
MYWCVAALSRHEDGRGAFVELELLLLHLYSPAIHNPTQLFFCVVARQFTHCKQTMTACSDVYRSLQNCGSGPQYGPGCVSPFWCIRFCWWLLDCAKFVVIYHTHRISGMLSVSGEQGKILTAVFCSIWVLSCVTVSLGLWFPAFLDCSAFTFEPKEVLDCVTLLKHQEPLT